jgi:tryptophan synthase beta chain
VATAGRWFGYLTQEQSAALDANGAHGNSTSGQE